MRHARTVAVCLLVPAWAALCGAVSYEGLWAVEVEEGVAAEVTRPDLGVPGAAVRVAPDGSGPVTGVITATLDLSLNGFDGATLQVAWDADPAAVHGQLLVDGAVAAVLDAAPGAEAELTVPEGGDRLALRVVAEEAAPEGWSVTLYGIRVEREGFEVVFSHDAAGLDVWVEAQDRLRFGVDPDWAELEWDVAGSVAAIRTPDGGVEAVSMTLLNSLPAGLFWARAGVDGEPILVLEPGSGGMNEAVTVPHVSGRSFDFAVGVVQPLPGESTWSLVVGGLLFEEPAQAPQGGGADGKAHEVGEAAGGGSDGSGAPAEESPSVAADGSAGGEGCSAGSRAPLGLSGLLLLLLGAGRPRRSAL